MGELCVEVEPMVEWVVEVVGVEAEYEQFRI